MDESNDQGCNRKRAYVPVFGMCKKKTMPPVPFIVNGGGGNGDISSLGSRNVELVTVELVWILVLKVVGVISAAMNGGTEE